MSRLIPEGVFCFLYGGSTVGLRPVVGEDTSLCVGKGLSRWSESRCVLSVGI